MRLFNVYFPTRVVALLFSEIALIFLCYVAAAGLEVESLEVFLFEEAGFYRIGLVTLCIVGGFYLNDLYSPFQVRLRSQLLQQVCFTLGIAFLIQSLLDYLQLPDWSLPKWIMIYGSFLVLLVQPAWRILYDHYVIRQLTREGVLFVGASPVARMVADRIAENPHFGQRVAGYLEDPPASGAVPPNLLLGPLREVRAIVESLKPHRIIIGTERTGRLPIQDLLDLRSTGIQIEEARIAYETVFSRICVKDLGPPQLIFMADLDPHPRSQSLQSIYSFVVALVVLLLALPLMLIVALLIKLTSRGPVFARQVRAGKNSTSFTLLKFRSPRLTALGRWLRRLHLDGLPQLVNVLRGEMAIVGPRPDRPEFVEILAGQIPFYPQRLAVKPGITGWAQINRKFGNTMEDALLQLEYDLYYIKNLNLTLDLYIMLQTVLARGSAS